MKGEIKIMEIGIIIAIFFVTACLIAPIVVVLTNNETETESCSFTNTNIANKPNTDSSFNNDKYELIKNNDGFYMITKNNIIIGEIDEFTICALMEDVNHTAEEFEFYISILNECLEKSFPGFKNCKQTEDFKKWLYGIVMYNYYN